MTRRLLAGFAALAVIGAGSVSWGLAHRPRPGAPVEVDVPPGATTRAIAELLEREHVIENSLFFRLLARLRGLDGRIEAGRYEMRRGMGVVAALDVLARPPQKRGVALTVPPGFTLEEIAERVGARTAISREAFLDAASAAPPPSVLGVARVPSLEGLLFPETYFVGEDETAAQLVRIMLEEFERRTRSLDWEATGRLDISRYDAVIVASMVEREAKVAEDRPKIAAVIYNRLRAHMRLQIDATALYGVPHKVPTEADLRRPSPWNTYLVDGLPPTPIASPSLDSLRAALAPAPIDALYYVVCRPTGEHCFTRSASEFERLKALRPPKTH